MLKIISISIITNIYYCDSNTILHQFSLLFLAYQRFREMYYSLDFCQLSTSERKKICDEALLKYEYQLEPDLLYKPSSRRCFRQQIRLLLRDSDDLVTDKFFIWECPPSLNHPERVYFTGKSHLKDSVFLYTAPNYRRVFGILTGVYTDALVYRINRFQLAGVRLLDEAKDELKYLKPKPRVAGDSVLNRIKSYNNKL